ncbi:Hsp20/alpha crystallin family protein [Pseudoduganella namucuonensis]|uniref:HSP20 family protein n=1 Tax=Pseudoduganella namucuonensis TaxID=1035707 RepID=A0A1I7HF73_9BURK|nr:Hsp20/alpha crystallin family protein [Pseudoduganella namucuonensis]SFU59106.1 HSP20 family protein [Pseudoduganella namucuonensis]
MAHHLTPFESFSDLARLDPFRGMDEFFREMRHPAARDTGAHSLIRLDVEEDDKAYTVKAEMPGLKKEDIKVDIDGNRVVIAAETRREHEQKQGNTVVRSERYVGQLYRSFALDQPVDENGAQASYRDGVLELTLPKLPNKSARKLTIN